jgi:hypothetical protein
MVADMSESPVPSVHEVEVLQRRAEARAFAHEPRRRLSAHLRAVTAVFAEAAFENERITERLRRSP